MLGVTTAWWLQAGTFGGQFPKLGSLALPLTGDVVSGFIFLSLCLSFPHFKMVMMRPALWGSCEHCINHGYQMLRRVIWHLITAQMLAIFITYYNPNFLNKVHLFMAPLNSVPHLNYSIHWNWSCTNSSIFIFPIYPPKKRHWHWWGKAMAISGSNWMSVEPLAWLFLKDNTDFPRLSSTMLV